jgi:hypothetical protein
VFAVVFGANITDVLDATIVNVAGLSIHLDLGEVASTVQWLSAGSVDHYRVSVRAENQNLPTVAAPGPVVVGEVPQRAPAFQPPDRAGGPAG